MVASDPPPNLASQRLGFLHQLLIELADTIEGPRAGEQVVAHGTRAARAASGAVGWCTDAGEVEIIASSGFEPGVLERWSRLPIAAPLPLPEVVRSGAALFFPGPEALGARYPHLAPVLTRRGAWAFAPLAVGARVLGGLVLSYAEPRPFAPDDELLVAIVAQVCAQALERARLARVEREAQAITAATVGQITRAHKRTQHLQRVTAALSLALTQADVARVIVAEGTLALGAYAGALVLRREGALTVVTSLGYPPGTWSEAELMPLDAPLPLAEAARTGQPIWLRDSADYAARYPHLVGLPQSSAAVAVLPLRSGAQVIGSIGLSFAEPQPFSEQDQAFAATLADHCAQALDRARLHTLEAERRAAAEADRARVRLLAELSQALAAALPDRGAVARQLLLQLGAQFADRGGLHLLTEDGRAAQLVGAFQRDSAGRVTLAEPGAAPVVLDGGRLGQAIAGGQPVALLEVNPPSTAIWPGSADTPVCSLIIVPLRARGRVLGALTVARSSPARRYTTEDLGLILDLADRAALAIDNAQLYASLQGAHAAAEATAERIGRLQQLTAALAEALSPADVARVTVEDGTAVLGAQAGMVALLANDGATLELVGATGYRESSIKPWSHFPLDAPLPASDAARTGQLILTSSFDELVARYPHLAERRWSEFESRAAIPLLTDQGPQGSLLLSFAGSRRFSAEDQDLMLLIGRQCAQALQRARLYAREQQARAEAEAAVRVREQFLSIAAHELKTPLTPLLGQAQLVERRAVGAGLLSDRDRRALQVIARQAQRLDQLVSSMLDLNRLQMGRLTLQRAPLDLGELARRIADELAPTLSSHTLELELPAGPVMISGDQLRLEQVLQNLLQNAVRYSPQGGPVAVRVARRGDAVLLEVRDHGIGIPAEALPRLFEPFFRAGNAEQRVLAGLGVGLTVVREIVTLHGGTVAASSVDGQGSTFTVTLPAHDAVAAPPGQAEREHRA